AVTPRRAAFSFCLPVPRDSPSPPPFSPFCFKATAPPAVSALSLHDALPICAGSDASTVVDADAELFPVFGSAGLPDTTAVFVIDPAAAGADTTTDSRAFPPFASAPTVQVTVPALFTQPALAAPNTTPARNAS